MDGMGCLGCLRCLPARTARSRPQGRCGHRLKCRLLPRAVPNPRTMACMRAPRTLHARMLHTHWTLHICTPAALRMAASARHIAEHAREMRGYEPGLPATLMDGESDSDGEFILGEGQDGVAGITVAGGGGKRGPAAGKAEAEEGVEHEAIEWREYKAWPPFAVPLSTTFLPPQLVQTVRGHFELEWYVEAPPAEGQQQGDRQGHGQGQGGYGHGAAVVGGVRHCSSGSGAATAAPASAAAKPGQLQVPGVGLPPSLSAARDGQLAAQVCVFVCGGGLCWWTRQVCLEGLVVQGLVVQGLLL